MSNQIYSIPAGAGTSSPIPPTTVEHRNHETKRQVDITRVEQKTDAERISKAKQDQSKVGTHINTFA